MIPVSALTDAMCNDRSETVTAWENRPANSPSMRIGVSRSRIVVSSVGVQNGACHCGPDSDAPSSSQAVTAGLPRQSSTIGCTDDRCHRRFMARGLVIAIPATCGAAPSEPITNAFSACASSSFTLPRSICSTAHCACRTTG